MSENQLLFLIHRILAGDLRHVGIDPPRLEQAQQFCDALTIGRSAQPNAYRLLTGDLPGHIGRLQIFLKLIDLAETADSDSIIDTIRDYVVRLDSDQDEQQAAMTETAPIRCLQVWDRDARIVVRLENPNGSAKCFRFTGPRFLTRRRLVVSGDDDRWIDDLLSAVSDRLDKIPRVKRIRCPVVAPLAQCRDEALEQEFHTDLLFVEYTGYSPHPIVGICKREYYVAGGPYVAQIFDANQVDSAVGNTEVARVNVHRVAEIAIDLVAQLYGAR